jgi:signal transduction histidine kinase
VGRRVPFNGVILRVALLYLAVFVVVLLALDAGAYAFMQREYLSLLGPALGTNEGAAALASAMRRVLVTIAELDLPLVLLVGLAAYVLARASIAPLAAARERERVFASDAAHELRSPLAAIASTAQAARSTTADPAAKAAFEEIARTSLDASAIVADLLTLARNPRRSVLQCEPVDLGAIVTRCAREMHSRAQERSIALDAVASSAIVDGDERRLRELARNLVDNALRHARSRVQIRSAQNNGRSEIVVVDDGDGVPPEDRLRVFERFYRRSEDGSGTGLGLAIVHWIAQAHDGTVCVDAAESGGARFVASFPSVTP